MKKLAAIVLALIPSVAFAEASPSFARARDKAQPVESLASFLSSFVGDCGSEALGGGECKQKVDAFRKDALTKSYYVILDDEAQKLVQQRGWSPQTHEMQFDLTPYFESAGLALTHGQPTKLNPDGLPVIPFIHMSSIIDENLTPMDIDRAFRNGLVKMQVVFKPLGLWKIARKDKKGAYIEGVKAQIIAVRLSEARSGTELVACQVEGSKCASK